MGAGELFDERVCLGWSGWANTGSLGQSARERRSYIPVASEGDS